MRNMSGTYEENFYRVSHLILDEIPSQLRIYFKLKWNAKYPSNPWDDTASSGQIFLHRERNRTLSTFVRSSIQNGDTDKWDGTTLFAVLLYSSHRLLQGDTAADTCINDLRQLRNECFAHQDSARINDADYQRIFNDVKHTFNQMNWSQNGITVIETMSLVTNDLRRLTNDMQQERANNRQLETRINVVEADLRQLQTEFESEKQHRGEPCKEIVTFSLLVCLFSWKSMTGEYVMCDSTLEKFSALQASSRG